MKKNNRKNQPSNVHKINMLNLTNHKSSIILIYSLTCIINLFLLIIEPILTKELIDKANIKTISFIDNIIISILVVLLLNILVNVIKQYFRLKIRNSSIKYLSNKIFSHIIASEINSFELTSSTYLVSRTLDDTFEAQNINDSQIIDSIFSILQCFIIMLIMFKYSPLITIFTLIILILNYCFSFSIPLTKIYRNFNEQNAYFRSSIANSYQGITLIKSANKLELENKIFKDNLDTFLKYLLRRDFFKLILNYGDIIFKQAGYIFIIVICSILISKDNLTLGDLTMMIFLYNILWSAYVTVANMIPLYKQVKVACNRINEVLEKDLEKNITNCKFKIDKINCIKFEKVNYHYKQNNVIIHDLSFNIKMGQTISLVGKSGCGKSTILKLILKFISPSSGNIYINDYPIEDINTNFLRSKIGYVNQQNFLFNRSIKQNLLYHVEDNLKNEEALLKFIDLFDLNKFISELPGKLEYIIGENATTISSGEKQRLCIIRELMKNPDIIILDEFTSNIDPITENNIISTLKEISKNKIIIQVSHRESTIIDSDNIYLIKDGHIIAEGNHNTLIKNSKDYIELFRK